MHRGPDVDLLSSLGGHKTYPATMSSIGMILLARLEPDELDSLYTGKAIPGFASLSDLKTELELTRRRGYGRLETAPGTVSIAFALGEPPKGAAALSGPMNPEIEKRLSERLSQESKEIAKTFITKAKEA